VGIGRCCRARPAADRCSDVSLAFSPDGTLDHRLLVRHRRALERDERNPLSACSPPRHPSQASPSAATPTCSRRRASPTASSNSGRPRLSSSSERASPGRRALSFTPPSPAQDLIAVYDDGTAAAWPKRCPSGKPTPAQWQGTKLIREEWRRFVPGHPDAKTCCRAKADGENRE
jgi:hypothetical protein